MKECCCSTVITAVACELFRCMDTDELSLLSADLIQLADTIAAMLVRNEICNSQCTENDG